MYLMFEPLHHKVTQFIIYKHMSGKYRILKLLVAMLNIMFVGGKDFYHLYLFVQTFGTRKYNFIQFCTSILQFYRIIEMRQTKKKALFLVFIELKINALQVSRDDCSRIIATN